MCKVNLNKELNGIELSFDSKPDKATLDSIKAQGFRWNGRKMVWYAKQTADRLTFAESLGEIEQTKTAPKAAESINLDNLGGNRPHLYGSELSAAIRNELKVRGCKGVTVSCKHGDNVTVTIKATPADFVSIEEAKERYTFSEWYFDTANHGTYCGDSWVYIPDKLTEEEQHTAYEKHIIHMISHTNSINHYHMERSNYWMLTTAFYNKVVAVYRIANQWNYDHSDPYTDYFDVGYYLDIDIKRAADFEPRTTMTEADRTAYNEEIRQAEEEAERIAVEMEEQRKKDEEESRIYSAWLAEATERIYNDVNINDLDETEQIYITNLIGGIGKESSRQELETYMAEHIGYGLQDAVITRIITITDSQAWEDFNKLYLNDFDFLAGKGGTASQDARLEQADFYKLNEEQRETIKFYLNDSIAVMYNGKIELVIDPEGYSYARYVYLMTETSEQKPAAEVLQDQRNDSLLKDAFYFPAPIEEQAAQLHEGQEITIYQCDGWILNSIEAGRGIVTGFYMGEYAQYKGLWIILLNGMKEKKVFIRDSKPCLIYEGIKGKLPAEVTSRRISDNMVEMLNYNELLPNTYNYYLGMGETPIIDTFKR